MPPVFGLPVFGLPVFGLPVFGLPVFAAMAMAWVRHAPSPATQASQHPFANVRTRQYSSPVPSR